MSEIIKAKKPKDIAEHIKIVNDNIQKIFTVGKDNLENENISLIPSEHKLYQNYPNPFNPVTKISFDLPENG